MKTLYILLISTCVLVGCTNSDDIALTDDDYLIFGHYYGECGGEGCIETFKLTSNTLYEDTLDNYSGSGPFNFVMLDANTFDQVKDLMNYFPSRLRTENNDIFGCPDCADGGGLFVAYANDGELMSWRIDQSKQNVPSYLHVFMDKINEKISLINN